MMETIKCPYCEEHIKIDTSEHYEGIEEYQCELCEMHFEVLAKQEIHYSSMGKADCLNGGEHQWEQIVGFPDLYYRGKYRCKNCSSEYTAKEELCTKEEWETYNNKVEA